MAAAVRGLPSTALGLALSVGLVFLLTVPVRVNGAEDCMPDFGPLHLSSLFS